MTMSATSSPSISLRRSSLPPPPTYAESQMSPKASPMLTSPTLPPAMTSTSSTHSQSQPLYRDPTFHIPSASASSSRPVDFSPATASSSRISISSISSRVSDPSTAPTTPIIETRQRYWRPTPNVPQHFQDRHRSQIAPMGEERNRWLSEDEGVGGSSAGPSRVTGRRRRGDRDSRSSAFHPGGGSGGGAGVSGGAGGSDGGGGISQIAAGPSRSFSTRTKHVHRGTKPAVDMMRAAKAARRPDMRRAHSVEHSLPDESRSEAVGANPPSIRDLLGPPTSPRAVTHGLGIASGQSFTTHLSADDRASSANTAGPSRPSSRTDNAPPYPTEAEGESRGTDQSDRGRDEQAEFEERRAKHKELLEKLRRILGCALCPVVDGVIPPLHHPVTLPCGHTLSASHISVPQLPPLIVSPSLPPHEVFELQQRQHQQRLTLWQSVMCPIPTCKRFSPQASITPIFSDTLELTSTDNAEQSPRISSGAQRGEMLASGVTYYPPAPVPPPDYTSEEPPTRRVLPSGAGSPLLDISVDKVIQLVERELAKLDVTHATTAALAGVELTDDEGEMEVDPLAHVSGTIGHHPQDQGQGQDETVSDEASAVPIEPSVSQDPLPSPSSDSSSLSLSVSLGRAPSKRQRNNLNPDAASSAVARGRARASGLADEASSVRPAFENDLMGVLECDVCSMLLHEPVTTPCQHSFCSKCLSRSLDHSSRCPVCRQDLPSFAFFQDHAVNKVLLTIIKTAFPVEYTDRCDAIERDERDARLDTPIFICTLAFPGMPTILHVFEPRYRLMIRRAIESSSPRFGMLLPSRAGATGGQGPSAEYGTMLEIQSVQMLPDGRSMVETVGTWRFKLLEKGNLDGYTVGRIERIDDISPEEEAMFEQAAVDAARDRQAASTGVPCAPDIPGRPEPDSSVTPSDNASASEPQAPSATSVQSSLQAQLPRHLHHLIPPAANATSATHPFPMPTPTAQIPLEEQAQTTAEYMSICRSFIDQLRSGSAPWLLQRLNNTYGSMPEDPSEFSYWMALVMPIDEYEKARLLPIRSPRLRLKLIVHWVDSLRSSWW